MNYEKLWHDLIEYFRSDDKNNDLSPKDIVLMMESNELDMFRQQQYEER